MRHASLAALVVSPLGACGGEAEEGSTPATSEAAPVPETTTMEATSETAATEETTTEAEAPNPPPVSRVSSPATATGRS